MFNGSIKVFGGFCVEMREILSFSLLSFIENERELEKIVALEPLQCESYSYTWASSDNQSDFHYIPLFVCFLHASSSLISEIQYAENIPFHIFIISVMLFTRKDGTPIGINHAIVTARYHAYHFFMIIALLIHERN